MKRKSIRLKDWEIKKVLRSRSKKQQSGLKLFLRKKKQGFPRFAVVVPTSFDKRASRRHKIDRRIRSVIQKIYEELPPSNFVIMVEKRARGLAFKKIEDIVKNLLSK